MVLPIVAYGDPILRKVGKDIDKDSPKLNELISNMWETMYNANGVGLAAPQIGLPVRLFLVDATPFAEDEELSEKERTALEGFKNVFINAKIEEEKNTLRLMTVYWLESYNMNMTILKVYYLRIRFRLLRSDY